MIHSIMSSNHINNSKNNVKIYEYNSKKKKHVETYNRNLDETIAKEIRYTPHSLAYNVIKLNNNGNRAYHIQRDETGNYYLEILKKNKNLWSIKKRDYVPLGSDHASTDIITFSDDKFVTLNSEVQTLGSNRPGTGIKIVTLYDLDKNN